MNARQKTCWTGHRGIALLVTLIFLTLFACLAVWIAASADANLTIAHNRIEGQQALAMAGTGLQLIQKSLSDMPVSGVTNAATMHTAIHDHLAAHLAADSATSPMLTELANLITVDPPGVTVKITLTRADGRQGTVTLSILSPNAEDGTHVTIKATANFGGELDGVSATRAAFCRMVVLANGGKTVLSDYGIASLGPVQMKGNAKIFGAHDPADGTVLAATDDPAYAILLQDTAVEVAGVAVPYSAGGIKTKGHPTILSEPIMGNDVPTPVWPKVDISCFEPFATNPYIAGATILSNVRIPASTTPRTLSNVTILGVLYIESPNQVTFSGTTHITGVIVAEPPSEENPLEDNLAANKIIFGGGDTDVLTLRSVEALVGAEYDSLKDLKGSFLLAPGFSTEFRGNCNFDTVNGCMVASKFTFKGGPYGTIRGGIVNLNDTVMLLQGNVQLTVDRQHAVGQPAGIVGGPELVRVSNSYREE